VANARHSGTYFPCIFLQYTVQYILYSMLPTKRQFEAISAPEIIISHDNLRWNDLFDSVTCVGTETASTVIKKFVHR
jgi:hypothetical protein